MEEDVHERLLDNSKTITHPLDNAHSRLIYVGKFTSQVPRCALSMDDGEEMDSALCPFDGPLKIEFQLHEKNKRCTLSKKRKKSNNDFKIVVITHWDLDFGPTDFRWHIRVYNLSTDSWRTIYYLSGFNVESSPFPELIPPFPDIQSEPEFAQSLLNGVYHWPCYCMLPEEDDEYEGVVMFDMVEESFRLMKGPPYPLCEYSCRSVWVLKDTIVMVVSSSDFWGNPCGTVGVWMMMEYGVHDSWAMVCTFGPMVGLTFVGVLDDEQFFFHDDKNQLISSSITTNDQFKVYAVYGLHARAEEIALSLPGKLYTENNFNVGAFKSVKERMEAGNGMVIKKLDGNLLLFQFFAQSVRAYVLNKGVWSFDGAKQGIRLEQSSEVQFDVVKFLVKA
ncbi:hypothetical protein Cgig2_011124 [Carnegiea gigantea]|uniref:F-box associated beta-propeller type 1 domain-containing protein n=1 Tax=Carnegiea gigantea TaxID=171969 RepID=A0A9Q1JUP1_9CARY|nr:hypothetical protein Cgig2_011124 [Carnegiea gigantea]